MESHLVMTLIFFESSRLGQPSFKRQNYIAVLLVKFGGNEAAGYLDHCRTVYLVFRLKEGSILRQKTSFQRSRSLHWLSIERTYSSLVLQIKVASRPCVIFLGSTECLSEKDLSFVASLCCNLGKQKIMWNHFFSFVYLFIPCLVLTRTRWSTITKNKFKLLHSYE